jgi:hypothetical protein
MPDEFSLGRYPQSSALVVYSERDDIQLDPDYQRISGIWTVEKRQLLIDSITYTVERRVGGVPLNQFIWDYRNRLKFVPSVIAALYLLEDEGLIVLLRSRGHGNWLDSITIYRPTGSIAITWSAALAC